MCSTRVTSQALVVVVAIYAQAAHVKEARLGQHDSQYERD
jgi:hypothetical protein